MTSLPERLRADLTAAMRAKDRETVKVLRTVLSAIANAEAQPRADDVPPSLVSDGPIAGATDGLGSAEVERRVLSADDLRAIVTSERTERLETAALLATNGADDRAAVLRGEAELLERYLD